MTVNVPDAIDYRPVLWEHLARFEEAFEPGIVVSRDNPEGYEFPERIEDQGKFPPLLPRCDRDVVLHVAEEHEAIGGGLPDAREHAFHPIPAPAGKMEPVPCHIRFYPEMEVRDDKGCPGFPYHERRAVFDKIKPHNSLITPGDGW